MTRARKLLEETVRARDRVLYLSRLRVGEALNSKSEATSFKHRVTAARAAAHDKVQSHMFAKSKLVDDTKYDLNIMGNEFNRETQTDAECEALYRKAARESYAEMAQIQLQQATHWEEVRKQMAAIKELSAKRSALVTQHLEITRQERQRHRQFMELKALYERHRENLKTLQAWATAGHAVGGALKDRLEDLNQKVDALDTNSDMSELRRDELEQFNARLNRYVVVANELSAKYAGRQKLASYSKWANELSLKDAKGDQEIIAQCKAKDAVLTGELKELGGAIEELEQDLEYWHAKAGIFHEECRALNIDVDDSDRQLAEKMYKDRVGAAQAAVNEAAQAEVQIARQMQAQVSQAQYR
jgi:chromosome segregation ATPase